MVIFENSIINPVKKRTESYADKFSKEKASIMVFVHYYKYVVNLMKSIPDVTQWLNSVVTQYFHCVQFILTNIPRV
jgi:hypothetical protein